MNKLQHIRTIWISDTHLGTRGCQAKLLLAFLKAYQCDTLYLVGDIIDGWQMRKKTYWPQTHNNVIRRILTMAKRGTRIVYVTGNHDEFLRKYSDTVFGNIELVDYAEHTTVDGRQFMLMHGDQFDVVIRYQKWLAILGDRAYIFLIWLNRWFNFVRVKLGYDYWSLSKYLKGRVKKAVNFIGDYEQAVVDEAKRRQLQGAICGHIHHAEIRIIDGIEYINCGDWVESCTAVLETHDGKIELLHWVDHLAESSNNKHDLTVTSS